MSMLRRWRLAEDGVAAIEGAIVLFAFIFLIFTIMEFLYVLFAYNSVVRAAENAARFAMVNSSATAAHTAQDCAWLEANVNDSVGNVGVIPVSISVAPAGCLAGTPAGCIATGAPALQGTIVIHAEYDFHAAGFFLTYLESTLPIQATVCVPLIA